MANLLKFYKRLLICQCKRDCEVGDVAFEAHPRQIAENLLERGLRGLRIHVSFAFHSIMHAAFSLTTLSLVTNQGRLAMAVKATPKHGSA